MSRRRFIQLGLGLGAAAGFAYSYQRGIRYPLLQLENTALSKRVEKGGIQWDMHDCFIAKQGVSFSQGLFLRAFAPEPTIALSETNLAGMKGAEELRFTLNNVSKRVELVIPEDKRGDVVEQVEGINRFVTVKAKALPIKLNWRWLSDEPFDFASIGDSGGQRELDWCLQRTAAIGADFLLHLGDFNYDDGDYDEAVHLFYNSPVPCYVSIGNHDFRNNSGSYVDRFVSEIGPLNNTFSLLGTRFINLDTAASFFPINGGLRGDFVAAFLADQTKYADSLVFTHRPFYDPAEGRDHDLGNVAEMEWLTKSFRNAGVTMCLAGHIHLLYDLEKEGVRLVIAGQGTGHQDIIHNNNAISKLAVGRVTKNEKVAYRFESLLMPLQYHCHPRFQEWQNENSELPRVKQTRELCEKPLKSLP